MAPQLGSLTDSELNPIRPLARKDVGPQPRPARQAAPRPDLPAWSNSGPAI